MDKHIDNFNDTINGKDSFNMDNIKDELKKDFETCYLIIKNKTEKKLRQNYIDPINSNESRQNINFSFKIEDVIYKLSFYKSSESFNKILDELIEQKNYKADDSIFKDIYDSLIEKINLKEDLEIKRKQLEKEKLDKRKKLNNVREIGENVICDCGAEGYLYISIIYITHYINLII